MTSPDRLPYPGLRAYSHDEIDLFFGRERSTDAMVERLAATRFLAVLGPSGSGKSSLVRTGLLDALDLGLYAAVGSDWRVADFSPGVSPLTNLARAVVHSGDAPADAFDVEALLAEVEHSPFGLIRWANGGHLRRGQNLLLLVDQFEELFRYSDYSAREEAEAFVNLLLESVTSDAPIHVVLTMRSEFLGACALLPELAERINQSLYLIGRMSREECRAAIEGPAGVLGFDVEPALVSRLLNDLAAFAPWDAKEEVSQLEHLSRQADQLPLMQHVLNWLWMRRPEGEAPITLTLAGYQEIGGVRGALDQHGEKILADLGERPDGDWIPVVEPLMRGLVTGTSLASAVRRPARLDELVALTGRTEDELRTVIEAMRAPHCSFLRPDPSVPLDGATVVDITHESLVRQWSRLAEWHRAETLDGERWRQLAAEAEAHAAGTADLLSETNLAAASEWLDRVRPTAPWAERHGGQFATVHAFLQASREAIAAAHEEERKRRRRMRRLRDGLVATLTVLLVVVTGASVWLYRANREKDRLNDALFDTNARLTAINRTLGDFKTRSVALVTDFATTMAEAQDAAVLGFSRYEERLSNLIAPFQAYTLTQASDRLTPAQILHFRLTYGQTLERLGADERSVDVIAEAFELAREEAAPGRGDHGPDFLVPFFEVVTAHAWNRMNAGDYAGADSALGLSEQVLAGLGREVTEAALANAVARATFARSRWLDEAADGDPSAAFAALRRVVAFEDRALAADPENQVFRTRAMTYRRNLADRARLAADALPADDPQRSELRRVAASAEDTLCREADDLVETVPLIAANIGATFAHCTVVETRRLTVDGDIARARAALDRAVALFDMLLASDPDLAPLQFAKLQLLQQRVAVERSTSGSETAAAEAGGALADHWLTLFGEGSRLTADVFRFEQALRSIVDALSGEETSAAQRMTFYRAALDALSRNLAATPDGPSLRRMDAMVAAQLAAVLRAEDAGESERLALHQRVVADQETLGTFQPGDAPSEGVADACEAYAGMVRLHARARRVDAARGVLATMASRCEPVLARFPWDVRLRRAVDDARTEVGALLFERGRYAEARPELEAASRAGESVATRFLAQMARLGLGVPRDEDRAARLDALARRQRVVHLSIPVSVAGLVYDVDVDLHQRPDDFPYRGIGDHVVWLETFRGAEVVGDVASRLEAVDRHARERGVSFPAMARALAQSDEARSGPPPEAGETEAPTEGPTIDAARAAARSGDFEESLGLLDAARRRGGAAHEETRAALVTAYGSLSGLAIRSDASRLALTAAEAALALDPEQTWIEVNRAVALMRLGDVEAAREIFMRHRGALLLGGALLWDRAVLDEFSDLRARGIEMPPMADITALFGETLTETDDAPPPRP
ncbi:hypothetical protein DLJ53_30995 [Acuticoccus sediminis]|uniref:Novel STAND NTPase 1 domain-containing protein n=1 Tax=Acuticoccus sediminis TaxID=2184697 RepID=A0A8B2NKD5_9HYPH|nr:hypothetical protein [Acuticoccus sediminis]RAH96696.1 hypothetical protein DLJ53_30995 [Acuticoccus sediminis]